MTAATPTRAGRGAAVDYAIKVRVVLPIALHDRDGGAGTRKAFAAIVERLGRDDGYAWTVEQRADSGVVVTMLYSEIANDLGGLEAAAYGLEELRRLLERAVERAGKRRGAALRELLRRAAGGVTVRTQRVRVAR